MNPIKIHHIKLSIAYHSTGLSGQSKHPSPAESLTRMRSLERKHIAYDTCLRCKRKATVSSRSLADMTRHLPVPVIVLGTAGTAGVIRVMRGMLLDELRKQYVITARTKGLSERRLLFRYPVRLALNPIISTVGWVLPAIVSGSTITALVLSLPTVGPLLFRALMTEDMYLAGTIVMFLCFLTILGMFLSDLLLAALDPRIRFEKAKA